MLYVGISRHVPIPDDEEFLYIADELPEFPPKYRRNIFDPAHDHIDPLKGMNYRKACEFLELLRAAFPGGETTLTKEAAEHIILESLLDKPVSLKGMIEESKDAMREKSRRMIERLFLSPVLSKVLSDTSFVFKGRNFARVNREELGEFDALVIVRLLMSAYKGPLVIPEYGPYAIEADVSLLGRLTAGVNTLDELPPKLRQRMLLAEKCAQGTTHEDADVIARYGRHLPGTDGFSGLVARMMKGEVPVSSVEL